MAERKVINKYYPPNYDPANPYKTNPKGAGGPSRSVRVMTPFTMRCNSCGEYIYRSKKFNAKKETAHGEDYLGIEVFRFYIRCPICASEITWKTDPKNTDYACEHGATRNFEPWREEQEAHDDMIAAQEAEDESNPMKAIERRTMESKREMDILDALDELRTQNARAQRINPDQVIEKLQQKSDAPTEKEHLKLSQEDEQLAKAIFKSADGTLVKRVKTPPSHSADFSSVFKAPPAKKPKTNTLGIVKKNLLVDYDSD